MLFVSIVIPTLNNERDLSLVLSSIRSQKYPEKNIEILVSDGGSTDNTITIAKKYGAKVFHNEKVLGEFGVSLGFEKAKGDVIMVLAADNELHTNTFITDITKPFLEDQNIILSYPIQDSSEKDTWISAYFNTFTDPINHFMYGTASNTRTFYRRYPILKKTNDYIVYNFSLIDYPLIALAQGTTVRSSWRRQAEDQGDDIATILQMIQKGYDLAYVPNAILYHHSIRTVSQFIRKMRWAFDNYLFGKSYGIQIRLPYFSWVRRWKKILWPFYAASILPPILMSIIGYIRDKQKEWLYHPILTYISCIALVYEFVRVKMMKQDVIQRK